MPNSNPITVVVPIDFSPAAESAIREAQKITRDGGIVRVIHVLPTLDSLSPGVVWGGVTDASRRKHVEAYMKTFLDDLEIRDVHTEIRIGDPGFEIASFAQECEADLIVIATHGHHGLARCLLGSVAERVIRHAHCSVLAIRRHDAN